MGRVSVRDLCCAGCGTRVKQSGTAAIGVDGELQRQQFLLQLPCTREAHMKQKGEDIEMMMVRGWW